MSANIYFSILPLNIYSIGNGLYFLPLHSASRGKTILEHTLFLLSVICTFFLAAPIYVCLSQYIFTDQFYLKSGNMTDLTPGGSVMLDKVSPVLLTICTIVVCITGKITNILLLRSRIPPLIKKIHHVDVALGVCDKFINNDRHKILWWTAITAFLGSVDLTTCLYENCRSVHGFELILTFPVCLISITVLSIELQFFVVCRIIEGRFRKLNSIVTSMTKHTRNNAIFKTVLDGSVDHNRNRCFFSKHDKLSNCLESLRFHYQILSECSVEVNSMYQCYLLISFICCFMEGLLCSYSFALSLTAKFEKQFGIISSAHRIFRAFYCLSRIAASSLAGMTVESEVSAYKRFSLK